MLMRHRVRRLVVWTSVLLSVLLAVAWVGSAWVNILYGSEMYPRFWISDGCCVWMRSPSLEAMERRAIATLNGHVSKIDAALADRVPSTATDDRYVRSRAAFRQSLLEDLSRTECRWHYSTRSPQMSFGWAYRTVVDISQLKVPLWMPLVITSLLALVASRLPVFLGRRTKAGTCGTCGYDRTGLSMDVVCPECGAPPSPHPIDATPALIATPSPHSGHAASAANPARL